MEEGRREGGGGVQLIVMILDTRSSGFHDVMRFCPVVLAPPVTEELSNELSILCLPLIILPTNVSSEQDRVYYMIKAELAFERILACLLYRCKNELILSCGFCLWGKNCASSTTRLAHVIRHFIHHKNLLLCFIHGPIPLSLSLSPLVNQ